MTESANWTSGSNSGGGTVPGDKSQPTEKQQEGTIMTEAAHKSAKICHSNNPANLQGDAHSVRRLTLAWNWEEIRETSEIFLSIIKMILVIKMKGEGG